MLSPKDYYQISSEYNSIDIPRMISKKATDKIRSLTNNTTVRIGKLDKLVGFYTGKLTNVGELINVIDGMIKNPYNFLKSLFKTTKELIRTGVVRRDTYKEEPTEGQIGIQKNLSKVFLSYYIFFHNVKKVKWDHPENYASVNKMTHSIISKLKESSLENKWREATPEEIHNLKMFKPEKIKAEMDNGLKIMKEEASKVNKLDKWEPIYNQAIRDARDLMDFILNNISDTDGNVKNKLV